MNVDKADLLESFRRPHSASLEALMVTENQPKSHSEENNWNNNNNTLDKSSNVWIVLFDLNWSVFYMIWFESLSFWIKSAPLNAFKHSRSIIKKNKRF